MKISYLIRKNLYFEIRVNGGYHGFYKLHDDLIDSYSGCYKMVNYRRFGRKEIV